MGKVFFSKDDELEDSNASDHDTTEISTFIVGYWQAYLAMDIKTLSPLFAEDSRRISQRSRLLEEGRAAIASGFKKEWDVFEKESNRIAENITIRQMEISVDDKNKAQSAVVMYWLEMEGGVRWHYEDQALILQVLAKKDNQWQIVHWTDAFSLDYDIDEDEYGEAAAFDFDYAYPVTDLKRAIEFYTPLLGSPEFTDDKHAVFNLEGLRFMLDASQLFGLATVRKNLPNGFALIRETSLKHKQKTLLDNGAKLLEGTDKKPVDFHGDSALITADTEGNVMALVERSNTEGSAESKCFGFHDGPSSPFRLASEKIAMAWLKTDASTIASFYRKGGYWFDDTKVKFRGLEDFEYPPGGLKNVYWKGYPAGKQGLAMEMRVTRLKEVKLKSHTIVSYERELSSRGRKIFREKARVTHVFTSPDQLAYTFITDANQSTGMAISLDYAGHPVSHLKKTAKFYEEVLELGEPYTDDFWRGFWSNGSVIGIYTRDDEKNNIPAQLRANGYMSFWVRSAEETYNYLKQRGAVFPIVPAINNVSGIESRAGYHQVVTADSEGNIVIFSEYTGRQT